MAKSIANANRILREASDAESIIFGHSSQPQEPEGFLYKLGGRFRGLFLVESVLYKTDKHVKDNITSLGIELSLSGVFADNIKDIYILRHSLGKVDMEYFAFLKDATSMHEENEGEEESDTDVTSGRLVSDTRTEDARWHITYYSPADKQRAEQLMKKLGCKNYELLGSINEAIERLRFDNDLFLQVLLPM